MIGRVETHKDRKKRVEALQAVVDDLKRHGVTVLWS